LQPIKVVSPLDTLEIKSNEIRNCTPEKAPPTPLSQPVGDDKTPEIGFAPILAASPAAQDSPRDSQRPENRTKYFGWGLMIATAIVLLC
jgi:hypothetical protein